MKLTDINGVGKIRAMNLESHAGQPHENIN